MSVQPLHGITVLDFTTLLPGPLAALFLAEAGAEVIKIERPDGEEMRIYIPQWGDTSVNFNLLNRGKKGVTLDLKDPDGLAAAERLVREADVLIEQFRPGVMDRLGLGYERCKELNPGLVYCAITGFGQSGPKADVAGHDLNYISETGLLALSMGPSARPTVPPALIADIAGGSLPSVINILMALLRRNATGEGAFLDIAMSDCMFMFGFWAFGEGQATGAFPASGASILTGGSPRYQIYPTAEGRHVAAAPLEQKFWQNFCRLIELPAEHRNDWADPAGTIEAVRAIIAAKPSEHWRDTFAGEDCCCTIVASLEEALQDPHFRERGLFAQKLGNAKGETMPALPLPLAPAFRGSADAAERAPGLGEHNPEILRDEAAE